jgi:hypothetical protein
LILEPADFSFVMAGLDPAIHAFLRYIPKDTEDVDARHKAGYDE